MKQTLTMREALESPALFGTELAGDSWQPWRVILMAGMGEELTPDELKLFTSLTGRTEAPKQRVDELWAVVGRRGGKSKAMSALVIYLSCLCDHSDVLSAGETGRVLCIAPDRSQAAIVLDYVEGLMLKIPVMAKLISNRTNESLELSNGIIVEVRGANFRRLRGSTNVAVICDEAAYWLSDESANPDTEILNAVRPTMLTTKGQLAVISSPYARKGEVWRTYKEHYGPKGNPLILVAQGASQIFNPRVDPDEIAKAYAKDAAWASAEYGGEFRTDLEALVSLEVVQKCIADGVYERPVDRSQRYYAFTDPSGGSADSFVLVISHRAGQRGAETAVIDVIREVRPPFSPEAVVEEFCDLLKQYRVSKVSGDNYAGEWPKEQFRKFGVNYEKSARSKSELFLDMIPYLNSRMVDLLDHSKLVSQLVSLDRRTSGAGKDRIEKPKGGHDDVANAVAGAVMLAAKGRSEDERGGGRGGRSFPKVDLGYAKQKEKAFWR